MSQILIDTNIYLEFYASARLKELLPLLTKVKDYVFVSAQIVSEVRRNQLSSATRFLQQTYLAKASTFKVPQHLVEVSPQLEKRITEANNSATSITRELESIYAATLVEIAHSRDQVSQALSVLFEKSWSPTEDELQRARLRRELGNPPGKQNDPLGDQLTWEQFLTHAPGEQRYWIITKDSDYCDEVIGEKNPVLVPSLYADLVEKCQHDIEVRCFRTLADGLKDFISVVKVSEDAIPSDETFEAVGTEERRVQISLRGLLDPSPTAQCHRCHAIGTLIFGGCTPSVYGGWTLKHRCRNCGLSIDTGESCDDD